MEKEGRLWIANLQHVILCSEGIEGWHIAVEARLIHKDNYPLISDRYTTGEG
jgi:hypothetical protein